MRPLDTTTPAAPRDTTSTTPADLAGDLRLARRVALDAIRQWRALRDRVRKLAAGGTP